MSAVLRSARYVRAHNSGCGLHCEISAINKIHNDQARGWVSRWSPAALRARSHRAESGGLDKKAVCASMLEVVTTKSDILRLIQQRGALKDSELARLLGVAHQQVNQAARGLAAARAISRVPGPDGVIRNHLNAAGVTPPGVQYHSRQPGVLSSARAWPMLGDVVAGRPVTREELAQLGFVEHQLEAVHAGDVDEAGLIGWNTLGPVPDAPGLYCFVGQQNQSSELRVFYVGMTSHLWMVAKGQLPGGIARGGQRYGRPRHAGTTRQRVNAEVARLASDGWTFSHWLRAVETPPDPAMLEGLLRAEESHLITMWGLRIVGWNRG